MAALASRINSTEEGYIVVDDDGDVTGYDVGLRQELFDKINDEFGVSLDYEVRVYMGYTEVFVRTRNGDCDIGFTPFFNKANRERCTKANFRCAQIQQSPITSVPRPLSAPQLPNPNPSPIHRPHFCVNHSSSSTTSP